MSDGTLVKEIAERIARPEVMKLAGDHSVAIPEGWSLERAPAPNEPSPLALTTLTSLVRYMEGEPDGSMQEDAFIHLVSPTEVYALGALEGGAMAFRRCAYVRVRADLPTPRWGHWLDPEGFIIWLQTGFEATAERDELIRFVSTISDGMVRTASDDGVRQEVATRKGITLLANAKLPSPVVLRPYRTFHEVPQPASPFVLRARSGSSDGSTPPVLALFEVDGGRWQQEATRAIEDYLAGKLAEGTIILA